MDVTITEALDMGDRPETAGQRTLPNWKVADLLRAARNAAQREQAREIEALRLLGMRSLSLLVGTRKFMLDKHGTKNRERDAVISDLEKALSVEAVIDALTEDQSHDAE